MSECVAESKDIRQLEKIRRQQLEAREVLQQLDQRHLVSHVYKILGSGGGGAEGLVIGGSRSFVHRGTSSVQGRAGVVARE